MQRLISCILALVCASSAFAQAGLPRLVTEQRLTEYFDRYMVLSEAQRAQIDLLHEAYTHKWAESFNDDIRQLRALWSNTYVPPEEFHGESMSASFDMILARADELRSRMTTANTLLFDQVQVLLTEDQIPGLQRVRLAHDRFSHRRGDNRQVNGLREQHIDLIAAVEQLELEPVEVDRLRLVMLDFEPVFVSVLRDATEIDSRREQMVFQCIELSRQNELHGVDSARVQEADKVSTAADRIGFASQKRLVELNRRGLRMFCEALSPSNAAQLRDAYVRDAYPEVYPDPLSALSYYETVLGAFPGMEAERRAAIESFRDQYTEQHARLSAKMTEAVYDIAYRPYQLAMQHDGDDFGDAWTTKVVEAEQRTEKALRDLGVEREELNLAQPAKIRSLLLPEEIEKLPKWRWESSAPARPWGQLANAETQETRRAASALAGEERTRKREAAEARRKAAEEAAKQQPVAPAPPGN